MRAASSPADGRALRMSADLRDLYQDVILDHARRPRHFGPVPGATHRARGQNASCGDVFDVYLRIEGGRIVDAGFVGQGCAISTASGSLMTGLLLGRSEAEARAMFAAFHALATGADEEAAADLDEDAAEQLQVLAGVRQYPARVKCATLAWHAMSAALAGEAAATTEGAADPPLPLDPTMAI